jgi:hypothetical protein
MKEQARCILSSLDNRLRSMLPSQGPECADVSAETPSVVSALIKDFLCCSGVRNGGSPGRHAAEVHIRCSECLQWSGAGSNRRPSAFQEALLIHIGQLRTAEQGWIRGQT